MNKSSKLKTISLSYNQKKERVIKICFSFNDFDLLFKIRSLPGAVYHKSQLCWSVPLDPAVFEKLLSLGFKEDNKLKDHFEKQKQKFTNLVREEIKGLKGVLRPFQSEGVAFIEMNKGRALIADEMGLGKTIQALAWLQLHPELRPAIIVVPSNVKLKWYKEILKWLDVNNPKILYGETPYSIKNGDIFIINYDILFYWTKQLTEKKAKVFILDECHKIKSNTTKRTKAVKKLAKNIPHFIALSGTPILNKPIEIFNTLHIINKELFPDHRMFAHRYCGAKFNGFFWDYSGHENEEELHKLLTGSVMIRRLKKNVLNELPNKVRALIPLDLKNTEHYKRAENDFIDYLYQIKGKDAAERAKRAETLTKIETLKQIAVQEKLDQMINWIEDFIENGEKIVLFATHTSVINQIAEKFGSIAVKFDGSLNEKEKEKARISFQTDPNIKIFIGQIKAAGESIDLTAATNVAFLELPWTPGSLDQAEDRCHRMGQKGSVNVYYLVASESIEEKIADLLDEKRKILVKILDGEKVTDSLIKDLIKLYTL